VASLEQTAVIGVLVFAACVLRSARPYIRQLLNALTRQGPRPASARRIELTPDMMHDMQMWEKMLSLFNGRFISAGISTPTIAARLYTDAGFTGWGYFWGGTYNFGTWPAAWRAQMGQDGGWQININFLEIVALLLALREVLPYCAGTATQQRRLVCMIDNTSAASMLFKLSTRSETSLPVVKEIVSRHHPSTSSRKQTRLRTSLAEWDKTTCPPRTSSR
jgi:hypothetical protein